MIDMATPESNPADRTSGYTVSITSMHGFDTLTVVLRQPREVTTTDDIVEDEANNRPRHVVDGGCRRDRPSTTEDYREIDIFDE